jgi:uncharacterized membrane protein YccC
MCFLIGSCTSAQSQNCFPIVDAATQKLRDEGRREILAAELQSERQLLAKVHAEFSESANAERAMEIRRRTENVNALLRELARVDKAPQASVAVRRLAPPVSHSSSKSSPHSTSGRATFWNPYKRVPESESTFDGLTVSGREMP